MTRINCVPVQELTQAHLVAEYRELPRVYSLARRACERGEQPESHPQAYTLGTGHVKFFYGRLRWVVNRHHQLIREMIRRGYEVNFAVVPDLHEWPGNWCKDWRPGPTALALNRARIRERLAAK